MKRGQGKNKGSQFERDICKSLSLWTSKGKSIDLYWRSAMSGGRATVKKGLVRQAGDICSVSPEGHALTDTCYIECKHLKAISLDCLLTGKGELLKIWEEVVKQSAFYHKIPIFIFRKNRWPITVCTNYAGVNELELKGHIKVRSNGMYFVLFSELIERPFPL